MFDIGAAELLVIVVVAIIVIGPKDMPLAMRTAGRWIGKIRRVSAHFRSGIDAMIREAELEEMDRKWREQNERIMAKYPSDPGTGDGVTQGSDGLPSGNTEGSDAGALDGEMKPLDPPPVAQAEPVKASAAQPVESTEPSLPFDQPGGKG